MNKVNISRDNLYKYLNLIELGGSITNIEGVLEFTDKTLSTLVISPDKSIALKANLNGEYGINEKIGIENIKLLKDLISTFTEENLCININKNKLDIFSENNKLKVKYILKSPEYILNNISEEKFETIKKQAIGNEFTLNSVTIQNIINYFNKIKAQELLLVGENKQLTLKLEQNENEIIAQFDISEDITSFETKIGRIFIELLGCIKNDIKISILNQKPIYLNINTEFGDFEAIVAPMKYERGK